MPSRINSELRAIFSMLVGMLVAQRTGHHLISAYAFFAGLMVLATMHFAAAIYVIVALLISRIRENR